MLLTSSQISMGISSAIVFTFSTILFLSGYILQQQTVHDLQAILSPPPDPAASPAVVVAAPVVKELDTIQWKKVAYVQIVQQSADVCASSIIFAELARQDSKAQRILLYPRTWDADTETTKQGAKQLDRTMRFLRKIAARYRVTLRAIDADIETPNSSPTLSLSRLHSLVDLQALLYLNPAGVVYNAAALDELFTLDPSGAGLHFLSPESTQQTNLPDPISQPLALMIKPSMATYQTVLKTHPANFSLTDLATSTDSSANLAGDLFSSTFSLRHTTHQQPQQIEQSELLAAYMHFSDPEILGPDYDIPALIWNKARPDGQRERKVWEAVYADYRALRMAVCGLEVEPLPKTGIETDAKGSADGGEVKLAL